VEQPSVQPTIVRPYTSGVPPGAKDVFVWLTETPAPIVTLCLFILCYTNVLTYLLTYLISGFRYSVARDHRATANVLSLVPIFWKCLSGRL